MTDLNIGGLGPNAFKRDSFGSDPVTLPPALVKDIFKQVGHESVALKLAGTTPMSINGVSTTVLTGEPVAGVVGEGELKPLIKGGHKTKTWKPVKLAAIMLNSMEARLANPLGYFENVAGQLTSSIARAIDLGIFHGRNGQANTIIDGVEYLAQTKNTIRLGEATSEQGGYRTDLTNGWGLLAEAGKGVDQFAFDSRMRPKFLTATDSKGHPLFQEANLVDLKNGMGTLLGLPAVYDPKAVSGHMGACPDSYVRGFGGEFKGNLRVGFVENITMKRTDQTVIKDGDILHLLWQQNLEATLVECVVGWVISDVNDFVKYTVAPDVFKTGGAYAKDSLVSVAKKGEFKALQDVANAQTSPDLDSANWVKVG